VRREILPVTSAATPGFLTVVGVQVFTPGSSAVREDRREVPEGQGEGLLPLFGRLELAQGRLFLPQEDEVVLGEGAARDLKVSLGESVAVQNRAFRVVGLLQRTGNDADDYALYLSLEKLEELVSEKGLISMAFVRAAPGVDPTALAQEIHRVLRESEREFVVQSSKQLSDLVSGVLTVLRWTLGAIAGISLIVGGIGLTNTMLMAILERTREIGVLKAIGARREHIIVLFLMESGFLGVLGGLIGLLVGGAMAHSVALAAQQFLRTDLFTAAFDGVLIVGALGFSGVLGALAGLWPAWRAGRLDPVEALRYEL
jgi:putative ABC transport system permease protein